MGRLVNPTMGHADNPGAGQFPSVSKERLKSARKSVGLTQEQAAELMGLSLGGYRKLESGEREFDLDYINRAARAFNVPRQYFLGEELQVPLVGYVRAGATAHFYSTADNPDERVPSFDGATEATVAVEVRGESLGPFFDRWLIYYDDVRSPVTPDLFGELCVVGLPDDRVLVKQIQPSKSPGLYHLYSNTLEPPITDVAIDWAAKVKNLARR